MAPQYAGHRSAHFDEHYLAWVALYHFLPAALVRELSISAVRFASGGEIELSDIIETASEPGHHPEASWVIIPKTNVEKGVGRYLQMFVRALGWQNDAEMPHQGFTDNKEVTSLTHLESAAHLGRYDLGISDDIIDRLVFPEPSSVAAIGRAVRVARKLVDSSDPDTRHAVAAELASLPSPLFAVALKHIGDLCADSDRWHDAAEFYARALVAIRDEQHPAWASFAQSFIEIIQQSDAAADLTIRGPAAASGRFAESFADGAVSSNSLLLLNGRQDAMWAALRAGDWSQPDHRPTVLTAPQLISTHDQSLALQYKLEEKFRDSHRHFWSVLRRQVALGSAGESRGTKAHYARSMLDDLNGSMLKVFSGESFKLALSLLVESGDTSNAKLHKFSAQMVERYVNEKVIDHVLSKVREYEGSHAERALVAIEVFNHWLEHAPHESGSLPKAMLQYIADLGFKFEASADTTKNIGGRSVEILRRISEQRPEFCSLVAPDIANIVVMQILQPGYWTGAVEALKLSVVYADFWSQSDLFKVGQTILSVLEGVDPKSSDHFLIGNALSALVEISDNISHDESGLKSEIFSTLVKFGLGQKAESTRLLISLKEFDGEYTLSEEDQIALDRVIVEIREGATNINSSGTVEYIRTIFAAPALCGADGVRDALSGLVSIMNTADSQRASIAFPRAYAAILDLARNWKSIAASVDLDPDTLLEMLEPVADALVGVWNAVSLKPVLLAQFALPSPTIPNPVIVHNWAFASEEFAKLFSVRGASIRSAIDDASSNPLLAKPIAQARAIGVDANEAVNFDVSAIATDDPETFYAAIGQRIAVLQNLEPGNRNPIMKALLGQCLRLGPHALDLAVFVLAHEQPPLEPCDPADLSNYEKRLSNNRELRLALAPSFYKLRDVCRRGAASA